MSACRVRIPGSQKTVIEGVYYSASNKSITQSSENSIAIIMPSQGIKNTLSDLATTLLFCTFASSGFNVLRFKYSTSLAEDYPKSNNRNSTELVDANCAFDWLYRKHPNAPQIWVGGSGFGAYIAMQMLMRRTNTSGFIALSLPVDMYDLGFLSPCPGPGLLVHGTQNMMTPIGSINHFAQLLQQQRDLDIKLCEVKDAGEDLLTKSNPEQNDFVLHNIGQYIKQYSWQTNNNPHKH